MKTRHLILFLLLSTLTPANAADPILLRAGPLSMVFEPDNAFLRRIRIGDQLVLQGISAPVRDQYWGTVPPEVTIVRHDSDGQAFTLEFDVSCRQAEIDFDWRGRIVGGPDGDLVFTFDGEARSTFLRNRIGFCVLHGPESAGRKCVIETVDGKKLDGRLPDLISPHQPFKNLRAIAHQLDDGVWAHVRMEGDTFEMEDQRNWTDASFKTYCTPLELPFPVEVQAGTKIRHRVSLRVDGAEKLVSGDQPALPVLRVSPEAGGSSRLPSIGMRVSSTVDELTENELRRLRALHLGHLRVDLSPAAAGASRQLRIAAAQSKALGVPLIVGLHLGSDPAQELEKLAALIDLERPVVSHWLAIAPQADQLELVHQHLGERAGVVGVGHDTNFTELNRERPDPATVEVVSYGINPQVHAFDNSSMVETLAMQAETVRTARAFLGELPLIVSPVTLRPKRLSQEPPAGHLPNHVDARQSSLFAAAWTLASIKYLAESAVHSVTYFETLGWLGVMESERGSKLPERFQSTAGGVFPIYHALREVGEFSGGTVERVESTRPLAVVGLSLRLDGRQRLLLANLSAVPQVVTLHGVRGPVQFSQLDASNVDDATRAPEAFGKQVSTVGAGSGELRIELAAHAIARLDR